ncbi:DUF5447 family protein [Pseudomonas sp. CrR25]|nr:DUF5447 family protein [Pseudomonas sp. CrR25]
MSTYNRLQHAETCACSVCWSKAEMASPARSPSTPCAHCRRASARPVRPLKVGCVAGAWTVLLSEWAITPAFICEKHTPPLRPPKYWSVVQDSGRATPYVPRWDLFELEA